MCFLNVTFNCAYFNLVILNTPCLACINFSVVFFLTVTKIYHYWKLLIASTYFSDNDSDR